MKGVVITLYDARYKDDFIRLNTQWITTFFRLEESDVYTLENVDDYVLGDQGQIFLAHYQDKVVGCCALIYHPQDQTFELAKMAVDPSYQGLKIGRLLGEYLIKYAKERGVKQLFLEGNTAMEASIILYKKLGFYEIPISTSTYERCNIMMQFDF